MNEKPTSAKQEITRDHPDYRMIVEQRVRNRIMEYWEWVSDTEQALEYHYNVWPRGISVCTEVFERFADWVETDEDISREKYPHPIYTLQEREALQSYLQVWRQSLKTLPGDVEMPELIHWPEWTDMNQAAAEALGVFMKRGKLPEEKRWLPPGMPETIQETPEIGPREADPDAIADLNQALRLYHPPDMEWQLIAADSSRLAEFIAFLKNDVSVRALNHKFALMTLIFYSLEELLEFIQADQQARLHEFDHLWREVKDLLKHETAFYFHLLKAFYVYGATSTDELFELTPFIRGLDFSPELMRKMAEEYGRHEETPDVPNSGAAGERT